MTNIYTECNEMGTLGNHSNETVKPLEIVKYPLNDNQYVKQETTKKSIVFHHTASNGDAKKVVDGWNTDNRGVVGTCYVIGQDGQVIQCFDEKYWAYALGLSTANRKQVEGQAIQIELCAWGFLRKVGDSFVNDYGHKVDTSEVYTLDQAFKGFKYYHAYSQKQIDSLIQLVPEICKRHGIKGSFSMNDFKYSNAAVKGAGGFWTHNSFRGGKTDIYPDKRIIDAFKKGWSEFSS